jgi:S-adenosyl-L-methionine hydrolase (adenosine-forming)
MSHPIIALLTDFGVADHYVGTLKGVMLGICPLATLVDISHDVPAHDVAAGALELAASYRYFPAGTVFLAIVDPGVGSERSALAAEAGDYRFVAPDNGVLTLVLDDLVPYRVVELSERTYARPTISRTFEGRDRFAPAAAWLAGGLDLAALGGPVGSVHRLHMPKPLVSTSGIDGEVTRVDRFGNLITNIDRKTFDLMSGGEPVAVHVATHPVARVVSTYSDVAPGELCALFSSSDHLEIAARGTSAAIRLGVGRGAAVHIGRPA